MTIIGQNCLKLVKIGLYKAKISQKLAKIGPKSDQNRIKISPKWFFWNQYFVLIILVCISMHFVAKTEKPVLLGEPLVLEQK